MSQALNNFMDSFMAGPSCWPTGWRRAFLLTLPISAPLLIVAWALIIVGAIAFCFVCLIPYYATTAVRDWLLEMWRP